MKRILALVASQRKLGNGEILAKEVAAATGRENRLELIRLAELELKPCRGCYACVSKEGKCVLSDDLYIVAENMKDADGIVLAAPCYAFGPSAVAKLLVDRITALAQRLDDFAGKPAVVIGTAGIGGWEGYTLSALNAAVCLMGFQLKDSHLFLGALPGEGIIRDGAAARAHKMGLHLFGTARPSEAGECPTCYSDVWKFPSPGTATCAICGQFAVLVGGEQSIRWIFGKRSNRFDPANLKHHFSVWARETVQEFNLRREELSKIRERYKGSISGCFQ